MLLSNLPNKSYHNGKKGFLSDFCKRIKTKKLYKGEITLHTENEKSGKEKNVKEETALHCLVDFGLVGVEQRLL